VKAAESISQDFRVLESFQGVSNANGSLILEKTYPAMVISENSAWLVQHIAAHHSIN
jgi:hypothetical protein